MKNKFPTAFVDRIKKILPEAEWESFFETCTEPMPKTIREVFDTNPANTKAAASFLTNESWDLKPAAEIPDAYFIDRTDRTVSLGKTMEHYTGKMYIASLSSLLSAYLLNAQPGEKILDLCAAPGSKTTLLAEKVGPKGLVVANELSNSRIKKLASNLDRLGLTNTVITNNDGARMHLFLEQEFDRILVDAPCSSEGYGRKSSDFFRIKWNEKSIYQCSKLQKQLVESAFSMLRPDGVMIYSTCTTAPEENEAVVQHLLDTFGDKAEIVPIAIPGIPHRRGLSSWNNQNFSPEITNNVIRLYPHLRNEGWNSECFFVCKIYKKSAVSRPSAIKEFFDKALNRLNKKRSAEIIARTCKQFGWERAVFKPFSLIEKNGEFWLSSDLGAFYAKKNRYQRMGLKMIDKNGDFTTQFVVQFGRTATKNILALTKTQKERFLTGYDIRLTELNEDQIQTLESQKGKTVLFHYENYCLGWGKYLEQKKLIKNKLDRGWIF
jgi:16S rRNA (cytosine1407-C5)-methyltransferase